MAIVSFSRNFLFIKTRKTAGTSIQDSLLPWCQGADVVTRVWQNQVTGARAQIPEFPTLEQIEKTFRLDRKDYFTFGFTRNPFEITLSRFLYQLKMMRIPGQPTPDDFNAWVKNIYFVGEPGFPRGRYVKDRSRYLLFDSRYRPLVNFIGRFENLNADFAHICRTIGLNDIELVHVNRSNRTRVHYGDWMNDETIHLVKKHFDLELGYFSYTF